MRGGSSLKELVEGIRYPRIGPHLARAFVADLLKIHLFRQRSLDPLVLAYFVTFRCDLNCLYCGYRKNGWQTKYPEVSTEDAKRILEICRPGVPAVAFSGGEPLIRDDIVEIVHHARMLGYKPISLFTNSLHLPEREQVLEDLDFVQISLDTTSEATQDELSGSVGTGQGTKRNIQHYATLQKRFRFRININAVLTPATLVDLPNLMRFAEENGVSLTVCPELDEDGQPINSLRAGKSGQRYRLALESLLEAKRQGIALMDITSFLEHIRSFQPYVCYPGLSARVYPDGSLISPCPTRCNSQPNVLRAGSWKRVKKAILSSNGHVCERPCFLPCYLETSLMMRHPIELIRELSH